MEVPATVIMAPPGTDRLRNPAGRIAAPRSNLPCPNVIEIARPSSGCAVSSRRETICRAFLFGKAAHTAAAAPATCGDAMEVPDCSSNPPFQTVELMALPGANRQYLLTPLHVLLNEALLVPLSSSAPTAMANPAMPGSAT